MTPRTQRRWCRSVLLASLSAGLLAFATTASALQAYSEDAVKAAFLIRFAEYVDWPPEALAASHFTIAVLGADGVVEELQRELPGYQIKHLPAQVRKIRNVRQLGKAQILYVGPDHSDELGVAVAGVAAQPILLVTGEDRSLEAGGDIHFVLVDQRVRFEVSLPAAERSGLKISSKLLSVAIRVQTDRRSTAVLCEHRGVGESLNLVCNDRDVVQGGTRPTPSVGDPTQASSPSEEQRSVERSHVLESTPSSIQ